MLEIMSVAVQSTPLRSNMVPSLFFNEMARLSNDAMGILYLTELTTLVPLQTMITPPGAAFTWIRAKQ